MDLENSRRRKKTPWEQVIKQDKLTVELDKLNLVLIRTEPLIDHRGYPRDLFLFLVFKHPYIA